MAESWQIFLSVFRGKNNFCLNSHRALKETGLSKKMTTVTGWGREPGLPYRSLFRLKVQQRQEMKRKTGRPEFRAEQAGTEERCKWLACRWLAKKDPLLLFSELKGGEGCSCLLFHNTLCKQPSFMPWALDTVGLFTVAIPQPSMVMPSTLGFASTWHRQLHLSTRPRDISYPGTRQTTFFTPSVEKAHSEIFHCLRVIIIIWLSSGTKKYWTLQALHAAYKNG